MRSLGPTYKQFRTSIQTRENIPNFTDLISMLIIEEKNLGDDAATQSKGNSEQQVFYSNTGRGRGRGRGRGQGGGRTGNQQQQQQQNFDNQQKHTGGRDNFRGRGSQIG